MTKPTRPQVVGLFPAISLLPSAESLGYLPQVFVVRGLHCGLPVTEHCRIILAGRYNLDSLRYSSECHHIPLSLRPQELILTPCLGRRFFFSEPLLRVPHISLGGGDPVLDHLTLQGHAIEHRRERVTAGD
jgi:hypothetical protein